MLVLEGLVGLHRTIQLQLLSITGSIPVWNVQGYGWRRGVHYAGWHPGFRQILLDLAKVHLRMYCTPGVNGSLLVSCVDVCVHGHSVVSDSFRPQ